MLSVQSNLIFMCIIHFYMYYSFFCMYYAFLCVLFIFCMYYAFLCVLFIFCMYYAFLCVLFILMCIIQAFEDVNLYSVQLMKDILFWLNIIFATLFTIEMLMKWVAYGFKKYFTSFWTLLDFCIVVVSILTTLWTKSADNKLVILITPTSKKVGEAYCFRVMCPSIHHTFHVSKIY